MVTLAYIELMFVFLFFFRCSIAHKFDFLCVLKVEGLRLHFHSHAGMDYGSDLHALAPATVNISSKEIGLHARYYSRTSRSSKNALYMNLSNILLVVCN